ncbi:unnamed protein product [Citrullus colocynthis]|uniref:Uncharacterized protein n=1 Tax=Citrullus colocynthis TaxID=252529 RepID=A0ABP0Y045_9ROSI
MDDSSEETNKLHNETDFGGHCCCSCLPIFCNCESLVEVFRFIMKLLGFKRQQISSAPYRPLSCWPELSYTAASDPPPTDASGLESEFSRRRTPPPPPRSSGGGGQTD